MTQLAGKGGVSTKKTKQNNAHNEFAPDKWTVDDDPITIRSQKQADNIKPLPETAHGLQKACHLARYCDFSRCWHSIHHVLVASCVMLIVGVFFSFAWGDRVSLLPTACSITTICLIQCG